MRIESAHDPYGHRLLATICGLDATRSDLDHRRMSDELRVGGQAVRASDEVEPEVRGKASTESESARFAEIGRSVAAYAAARKKESERKPVASISVAAVTTSTSTREEWHEWRGSIVDDLGSWLRFCEQGQDRFEPDEEYVRLVALYYALKGLLGWYVRSGEVSVEAFDGYLSRVVTTAQKKVVIPSRVDVRDAAASSTMLKRILEGTVDGPAKAGFVARWWRLTRLRLALEMKGGRNVRWPKWLRGTKKENARKSAMRALSQAMNPQGVSTNMRIAKDFPTALDTADGIVRAPAKLVESAILSARAPNEVAAATEVKTSWRDAGRKIISWTIAFVVGMNIRSKSIALALVIFAVVAGYTAVRKSLVDRSGRPAPVAVGSVSDHERLERVEPLVPEPRTTPPTRWSEFVGRHLRLANIINGSRGVDHDLVVRTDQSGDPRLHLVQRRTGWSIGHEFFGESDVAIAANHANREFSIGTLGLSSMTVAAPGVVVLQILDGVSFDEIYLDDTVECSIGGVAWIDDLDPRGVLDRACSAQPHFDACRNRRVTPVDLSVRDRVVRVSFPPRDEPTGVAYQARVRFVREYRGATGSPTLETFEAERCDPTSCFATIPDGPAAYVRAYGGRGPAASEVVDELFGTRPRVVVPEYGEDGRGRRRAGSRGLRRRPVAEDANGARAFRHMTLEELRRSCWTRTPDAGTPP